MTKQKVMEIMERNRKSVISDIFFDTSNLKNDEIILKLNRTCLANPERQWLSAYYFDICNLDEIKIGYCDLRIGYNSKVYIGGNIGYGIDEAYRGHHYAAKACYLLFELARKHGMKHLSISCQPENIASERTIQSVGGELIEIADIPEDNEMYAEGKRQVKIYYVSL